MRNTILIPVKGREHAKTRLSSVLSAEERLSLCASMFDDLAGALKPLELQIVVVTSSLEVAAKAEALGWRIFFERKQVSESASVDKASRRLAHEGNIAVLRLPADIPLARTEDIATLVNLAVKGRSAVIVPSRDRTGTNALLRRPPDLFQSCFGPNSLARHIEEARRVHAEVRIVENYRIALDLDDPADLAEFLAFPNDTRTYRTLLNFNLQEKLPGYARE